MQRNSTLSLLQNGFSVSRLPLRAPLLLQNNFLKPSRSARRQWSRQKNPQPRDCIAKPLYLHHPLHKQLQLLYPKPPIMQNLTPLCLYCPLLKRQQVLRLRSPPSLKLMPLCLYHPLLKQLQLLHLGQPTSHRPNLSQ